MTFWLVVMYINLFEVGIWIPAGTFLVTTRFTFAALTVRGAGL